MDGWWRRNPFYVRYMLREASCVFVAGYALVLLAGLACLAEGRATYDAWRAALASPVAVAFHLVAFAFVAYHAWTWFEVMPKTLPFLRFRGRRVGDRTIVATGAAVAAAASLALLAAVWWTLR